MQGTVGGGLQCTNSLDQLCKKLLNEEHIMYKYRGVVDIPPLEMIDDIITAVECGPTSVKLNPIVNAFIESKKLALSVEKCAKVHIGNKSSINTCLDHKVHTESVKNSDKEKYLGDFISKSANSKGTIKARNIRGNTVLSDHRAILRDTPLGRRRTQIGLILSQAWFLNGCLFSREVWTGTSETDLKELEITDHKILREITSDQSKVPVEMLYLETAAILIKPVMAVRRILYLHKIVSRHKDELLFRVYSAMKNAPLKGDLINRVRKDIEEMNICVSDEDISCMSKCDIKLIV